MKHALILVYWAIFLNCPKDLIDMSVLKGTTPDPIPRKGLEPPLLWLKVDVPEAKASDGKNLDMGQVVDTPQQGGWVQAVPPGN